ncbi:hypothetical protein WJX72_009448 [[Myrmecia] bisecta]|uniref:PUB domain-containing protein n=1 Tax=[Myrmecia] bisecta TaxID=41462 RepID=A0AAW1PDK7_9CHLO
MDELKGKLKGLFGSSSKKFKGTGHVLGSTAPKPAPQTRQQSNASSSSDRPAGSSAQQAQQAQDQTQQQAAEMASVLAAMHTSAGATPPEPGSMTGAEDPQLQQAVATLLSNPDSAGSVSLLAKLLRNIQASPSEPKFRRLRLGNEKIHDAVVETEGGMELIQACGFVISFDEVDGQTEGFAVLPEDADLAPVHAALRLLPPAAASNSGSTGNSSQEVSPVRVNSLPLHPAAAQRKSPSQQPPKEPVPPRERNTRVLLPVETDTGVTDWLFDRSPAELKAAFMNAIRRREQSQVLMTKAYREKLAGGTRDAQSYSFAIIRVRLPEGLFLQGKFNAEAHWTWPHWRCSAQNEALHSAWAAGNNGVRKVHVRADCGFPASDGQSTTSVSGIWSQRRALMTRALAARQLQPLPHPPDRLPHPMPPQFWLQQRPSSPHRSPYRHGEPSWWKTVVPNIPFLVQPIHGSPKLIVQALPTMGRAERPVALASCELLVEVRPSHRCHT